MNREIVVVLWCFSQPGNTWCSELCEQMHCRGEVVTICLATLSSLPTHKAKQTQQGLLEDLLIDYLALKVRTSYEWYPLHWRTWSTRLWLLTLTVLLLSALATSETSINFSGTWFLGHTQKFMSHHQTPLIICLHYFNLDVYDLLPILRTHYLWIWQITFLAWWLECLPMAQGTWVQS